MVLLPNEKILMQSDKNILTLTTHRVRKETKARGQSAIVSITVDAVASCEVVSTSFPILLGLGVLGILGGAAIFSSDAGSGLVGILVGLALLAAYFVARTSVLKITSAGDAIVLPTKGMKPEQLAEFIDAVERQKLERLSHILAPVATPFSEGFLSPAGPRGASTARASGPPDAVAGLGDYSGQGRWVLSISRGVKTFHLTHERRWKELAMGPRANPPRRLAVWALSRTQVNSHREIASALRMSEGQVAKVLCRVRNEFTPGQLSDRMKTLAGRHVESGRA